MSVLLSWWASSNVFFFLLTFEMELFSLRFDIKSSSLEEIVLFSMTLDGLFTMSLGLGRDPDPPAMTDLRLHLFAILFRLPLLFTESGCQENEFTKALHSHMVEVGKCLECSSNSKLSLLNIKFINSILALLVLVRFAIWILNCKSNARSRIGCQKTAVVHNWNDPIFTWLENHASAFRTPAAPQNYRSHFQRFLFQSIYIVFIKLMGYDKHEETTLC